VGGRAVARLGATLTPSQQERWQGLYSQAVMIALVAGLFVARAVYALRYYPLYIGSPSLLFSVRPGTLAVVPGMVTAVVVLAIWLTRRGIGLAAAVDATAVAGAAAMVVFNFGQFLTGTNYGLPTDVPWGVTLWGTVRHPVQIYYVIAWLSLWLFLQGNLPHRQAGETFWRFVTGGSLIVLIFDAFAATSSTIWMGIRLSQVGALALLLAGLYLLSFYAHSAQYRAEAYHLSGKESSSVRE
jgi:phosphatidylglycerol---prolipoprotein diacylglyceryl transferase